jgi:hypothetical protein
MVIMASLVVVGGWATAVTPPVARSAVVQYYVDCTAGNDSNTGTSQTSPWRTLTKVNSVTYQPGDTIRFKSGTRCTGTLSPRGSGTSTARIAATSYGAGSLPGIDGNGATAAVYLRNVQGWTLSNLDVTNTGAAPGATERRVGIYVLLENFGTGSGYTISNVNVHNVNGCDCRYPQPTSGGILFHAGGATTPTGFADITIKDNIVSSVDREGIATSSDWQRRAENPSGPGTTWVPITGLRIANNRLSHIGGDGVLVLNGSAAVVENNTLAGFNERSADFNAGVVTYNSNNTTIQFNDVSGGVGTGMAFDLDGASNGGVFQYNLSRSNNGGFFMICAQGDETTSNGVVRYNISQNDVGEAPFLGIFSLPCTDAQNTQIYNNTIYTTTAANLVNNLSMVAAQWRNNIFYGRASGSAINDSHGNYANNLYYNVTAVPSGHTNVVLGNPWLMAPGGATSMSTATGYQLAGGSRARGRGVVISGAGGRDFFGNVVTPGVANIGAYEGPGAFDFANTSNVNIPDAPGPAVTSPITTSGLPGTSAGYFVVGVDIVHAYRGDLVIDLVAPDGSAYRLKDDDGDPEPDVNATYIVDVAAEAPNGTWRLRVQDMWEVDTGFIDSWRLTFIRCNPTV